MGASHGGTPRDHRAVPGRPPVPGGRPPPGEGEGLSADLARLAELHGVATSYQPAPDHTVPVSARTVIEVLGALGVDAGDAPAVRTALERHAHRAGRRLLPSCLVSRPGRVPRLAVPEGTVLRVETEEGALVSSTPEARRLGDTRGRTDAGGVSLDEPPFGEVPAGCHTLRAHAPDGRSALATLIVAPSRVPQPPGRGHGFAFPLPSLLSARSWGMGDLGDLADFASWAGRSMDSGFLQTNPLHAASPGAAGGGADCSPCRPSSRRFPDPVYLRVEDVPEYAYLHGVARRRVEGLLARAARLRASVLDSAAPIDRGAVWEVKRQALELIRSVPTSPGRRAAYCDFLAERGQALDDYATWCALAEVHGPDWRAWPSELRDPRSGGTARARGERLDRVDFHCWLAWLTDGQLAAAQRSARDAGMAVGVVHSLAAGVHPAGADTWAQRDVFAAGVSMGAAPDAYDSRGRDWGVPPWRPDALAATGYASYRAVLRGLFRHAGGVRVEHVMGLFRVWWVPHGRPPTEGTYVRYDAEAMLGLLALEAGRAGAVVIGEENGGAVPGGWEALDARGVLRTSVLWREREHRGPAGAAGGQVPGEPAPGRSAATATVRDAGAALPSPGSAPADAAGCEVRGRPSAGDDASPGRSRPREPARWRKDCLAVATTYGLPTLAGRLTGESVELWHRLGRSRRPLPVARVAQAVELAEWMRLVERSGLLPEGRGDEEGQVKAVYRLLARSPARLVGVWLPDAVGDRRPSHVPGAGSEYPNWRLPIADPRGTPVPFEALAGSARLHALMDEVRAVFGGQPADSTPDARGAGPSDSLGA